MRSETATTIAPLGKSWKLVFSSDFFETLRARWYQLYAVGFAGIMALFFYFGLTESRVMGFTGLGRVLLTFIQLSLIILPVFVLVTTARTLVSDREAGVWEYVLSLPISLRAYYWGKVSGRFCAMLFPLMGALMLAAAVGVVRGDEVPWAVVVYYSLLLAANVACFLGLAMLLSVMASSQEMAIGGAFGIWLITEALVDALLLGLMVKERIQAELVLGIALLNPLQAFRMAAIALFDPDLTVLGPIAYTIADKIGRGVLLGWALVWPAALGLLFAFLGERYFRKRDLV